ncbi:MAG: response regulator transcription factor [Thermoanaerobacteraceae bacterium]
MHKVLIVEDDVNISKVIQINLESLYETVIVGDGESAIEIIKNNKFSAIILDIMLPGISGFDVIRTIKALKIDVPILVLTAKSQDVDKIFGLELGADDYITKPFNPRELVARVKALIRRVYEFNSKSKSNVENIEYESIKLNLEYNKVYVDNKEINLTPREFQLLKVLITHKNKILTRDELIEYVWGRYFSGDTKTLDVHIRRLREKIEANPEIPRYIHTQWGVGYYFGGN